MRYRFSFARRRILDVRSRSRLTATKRKAKMRLSDTEPNQLVPLAGDAEFEVPTDAPLPWDLTRLRGRQTLLNLIPSCEVASRFGT